MNDQEGESRKELVYVKQGSEYFQAENDEISLVDLLIVLMRRKWVVIVVTIFCVLVGLAFWATKERQQRYITNIEVGKYINENGEMRRIEAREEVASRLRNSIIPLIRNEVAERFEENPNRLPKVSIKVPEEDNTGDFVILKSEANPGKKNIIDALHQGILERLSKVHDRMYNNYKNRFSILLSRKEIGLQELRDKNRFRLRELAAESKLEEALETLEEKQEAFPIAQQKRKHDLEQQKDGLEAAKGDFELKEQNLEHMIRRTNDRIGTLAEDRKRLEDRLDRISVKEELLAGQQDDLRKWMNNARESQQNLYESVGEDANLALASLMLGNQAEEARKRLTELRSRLSIDLPERQAELEAKLEANKRKTVEARETVAELKAELKNLKQDHTRDIRERERNIAQLQENIEKEVSDHRRIVEADQRKIKRLKLKLKELQSSHQREIERKESEIELFENKGGRMEATGTPAVVVPTETMGRGGMMIGALSLVLGLMLGVFAAFFTEFTATARKEVQEREK